MKKSIIVRNNYENEDNNENKKIEKFSLYQSLPTFKKERFVFDTYAQYYLDFFEERNVSTPMFVDTNDFRTTKTVYISSDIMIQSGITTGLQFDPFSEDEVLTTYQFSTNITKAIHTDFKTKLVSFSKYKIVLASIKIKQVSILTMADGYGTVLDAVMVPSTFDPYTQGLSPLNVNNGMKFKLDTIDGRAGVKGCILGTPFDDWKLVARPIPFQHPQLFFSGEYRQDFPSGTKATLDGDRIPVFYDSEGKEIPVNIQDGIVTTKSRAATVVLNTQTFMEIPKGGMKIYVKITPPNQPVTFKVTYKVALEVVPGPTLIEDVQTFSPPFNYSTERIFSSIYKNYKCLSTIDDYQHDRLDMKKDIKAYASSNIGNNGKINSGGKESKFIPGVNDHKAYASSKVMDNFVSRALRKRKIKLALEAKPEATIPEWVKQCVEFLGENVGKITGTSDYMRNLRNATAPIPNVNWQFFPVIYDTTVMSAIFAVRNEKIYSDASVAKITMKDANDKEFTCNLYYKPDDLDDPEDFTKYIVQIMGYLNNVYYAPFEKDITIRFFSPGKVADRSYGAAVIAAFMNAYPGQLLTGTLEFEEKDENLIMQFEDMDQKTIEMKASIASPTMPLMAPNKDANIIPFMVSGIVLETVSPNTFTFSTLNEFLIAIYLVPRVKGIKQTPASNLVNEINIYLSNLKVTPIRKFLYLRNYAPPEIVQKFVNNPDEKIDLPSNAYIKCKPSQYGRFIFYGLGDARYVDLEEYFKRNPSIAIKSKIPSFSYANTRYFYIPNAVGLIPKNARKLTSKDITEKRNEDLEKLKNMTSQEMNDLIGEYFKTMDKNKNMDSEIKKYMIKNKVPVDNAKYLESYKEMLDGIAEIAKNLRETVSKYKGGQKSYLIYPQLGGALGITTKIHNDDVGALKEEMSVKMFNKLSQMFTENDLATLLIDAGVNIIRDRPRKSSSYEDMYAKYQQFKRELKEEEDLDNIEETETEEEEESEEEINEKKKRKKNKKEKVNTNKKTNKKRRSYSEDEEDEIIDELKNK